MTMPRRTFLGLAASVLPASAMAFDFRSGSGSSRPSEPPPGSVGRQSQMLFVGEGNRRFGLTSLLVLGDNAAWYADFKSRVVKRDEDRIGILRDIPLVGKLFAPRLRTGDFNASREIGLTFRVNDAMVVDLHRSKLTRQALAQKLLNREETAPILRLPGARGPVRTVGVVNQKISYFLVSAPLPVQSYSPPAPLRALAGGTPATQIGRAYNNGEALLVSVSPSIFTGWS